MTKAKASEDASCESNNPYTCFGAAFQGYIGKYVSDSTIKRAQLWLKFCIGTNPESEYTTLKVRLKPRGIALGAGEFGTFKIGTCDTSSWYEEIITWDNKPSMPYLYTTSYRIKIGEEMDFDLLPYISELIEGRHNGNITVVFIMDTLERMFYVATKEAQLPISDTVHIYFETKGDIPSEEGLFDTIGTFFDDWSGYFHTLADDFNDTWLIGGVVFDTLWIIGNTAFNIGHQFHLLQDWKDSLDTKVSDFLDATGILALVSSSYDIVGHTWSEVEALIPSWTDLVPTGFPATLTDLKTLITTTVSGAYDILAHTWSEVVALIPSWTDLVPTGFPATLTDLTALISSTILGTFTSIDKWFEDQKSIVLGWVTAMFPYDIADAKSLLTWLGISAGDVITTVLGTPAEMFAWIKEQIDLTYDIVGHTWSEVEALIPSWTDLVPTGFPATLTDLTALISSTILGTFTSIDKWFEDQKIEVLGWVVDYFESILDKVFKE